MENHTTTVYPCIFYNLFPFFSLALTASLGRVRKELLPLTDAVKGVVCDPSHPIGQRHLVFCEEITVLCTDTAMPNILAFGVPRVGPVVLEERGGESSYEMF